MLFGYFVLFKLICYVDGCWIYSDSVVMVVVVNFVDQVVIGYVLMFECVQIVVVVDVVQCVYEIWCWML